MIYTATTGGERGPAAGVVAASAVFLGGVCYTIATAIGISAVMAAYPAAFAAIRVAGIIYLIFLGIKQLNKARDTSAPAPAPNATGGVFRTGFLIAITNPQLATFFLAFLPQFVVADGGPVWLQFLKLGVTFNLCSFLTIGTIGIVTGFAGKVDVGGTRFRQVMRVIAGLAFIVVALRSARALLA